MVVVVPRSVSREFEVDYFVPEGCFEEEEVHSEVDSHSGVEYSVAELGSAVEHSLGEYVAVLH